MLWNHLYFLQPEARKEICEYDNTLNFVIILVKNNIEIVERNVDVSDHCIGGICSVSFSSSEFPANVNHSVTIVAANIFGSSNATISTLVRKY